MLEYENKLNIDIEWELDRIDEQKISFDESIKKTTIESTERYDTRNLEKLNDIYNKLNKEITNIETFRKKLSIKKTELEIYLNMDPDENEKPELYEKFDKYGKEITLLEDKLKKKKEERNIIKSKLKLRLKKEEWLQELNERFLKIFKLNSSDESLEKYSFTSEDVKIESTIVKENWKEIWQEIKIIRWKGWDWEYIFRDNDGNYYHYWMNDDGKETTEEGNSNAKEPANLKEVCRFLREINDILTSQDENSKITESDRILDKLIEEINFLWIPSEALDEYINIVKESGDIGNTLNESSKTKLWLENIEWDVSHKFWCILFYIKKLCPNRSNEIIPFIRIMFDGLIESMSTYAMVKKLIWSIEYYWDSAYEYLRFCSPFAWSYIKEWASHVYGKYFWETLDAMKERLKEHYEEAWRNLEELDKDLVHAQNILWYNGFLTQFLENFTGKPESLNLFSFLKDNPQKLDNLWGKEIKSINLSLDSWINFAFRGIIEFVKTRPDIDFPYLEENPTDEERKEWKQQRVKIIKEYENMLRNYIARDNPENNNSKWKAFDKIFFTLSQWCIWFSDKDSDIMPSKDWAQQFSWTEVVDYSKDDTWETKGITMISDIEKYAKEHPNEKILVCVNHHWSPDWSSSNWWAKDDWIRLANISNNIKIWSIRCFFWNVFDNKNIYDYQSSISGFSNNTVTMSNQCEIVGEARKKNLWLHEMEIYTRLYYSNSVGPLTESMEYTDWNTWKSEIWKIGLAQNNDRQNTANLDYV